MKITKIIVEWEDGKKVGIEEPEITRFLKAGGNKELQVHLLFALARNVLGGYHWKDVK